MKPLPVFAVAAFAAVAVVIAGCRTSPYDYPENWLIREDASRPFSVPADLIYIQDRLYVDLSALPDMIAYARKAVGKGKFGQTLRVFSPLVANEENLKRALDWYFSNHHHGKRPFFFIGEGAGGALLKAYEEENADSLKRNGFVAGFYTEMPQPDFVDKDMVRKIQEALIRVRYRKEWGREMPEGMMEKTEGRDGADGGN